MICFLGGQFTREAWNRFGEGEIRAKTKACVLFPQPEPFHQIGSIGTSFFSFYLHSQEVS
jgi:hypothetical protein